MCSIFISLSLLHFKGADLTYVTLHFLQQQVDFGGTSCQSQGWQTPTCRSWLWCPDVKVACTCLLTRDPGSSHWLLVPVAVPGPSAVLGGMLDSRQLPRRASHEGGLLTGRSQSRCPQRGRQSRIAAPGGAGVAVLGHGLLGCCRGHGQPLVWDTGSCVPRSQAGQLASAV